MANFHVKCPSGWLYSGDVSIQHGGTFYKVADLAEHETDFLKGGVSVEFVECRGVEGCDNQYNVERGSIWINPNIGLSREKLASEFGWSIDDMPDDVLTVNQLRAEYIKGYFGFDTDMRYVVQIGKKPDEYANSPAVADVILNGNCKIENYLVRTHLGR